MGRRTYLLAFALVLCQMFYISVGPTPAWGGDCRSDEESFVVFPQDEENLSLLGRWAAGPCRAVHAVDNVAYFSNGSYLDIVDFSNPELPSKRGQFLLPGLIHGAAVVGDLAYVANRDAGLVILDVSDPANPERLGGYDSPGLTLAVDVNGDYAYIADFTGVRVVLVADPDYPVPVGYFDT